MLIAQNNIINIQLIQPAIAKYRKELFLSLLDDKRFNTIIISSIEDPIGVKSIPSFHKNIDLNHSTKVYLKRAYWQSNLRLLPHMKQGDVLIINGNPRYFSNYPLIFEAKKRNVAVVWWGHGWSPGTSAISFYIRRHIMKIADSLLLYTEKEKEMFIQYKFDPERIFYVNNTLYTKKINDITAKLSEANLLTFKKENNLENKKIMIFSGRLRTSPSTRLSVALKALRRLKQKGNDYTFIIIGDGEDMGNLKALVKELALEDSVIFLGAIYKEEELAHWFLSADCAVYPGAIGLSLIHYFAYGLPVVTNSDINKHGPEISALKDGINGLLFKKDDESDLAEKIHYLMEHTHGFGKNALKTVSQEYSFDSAIKRFKHCLTKSSDLMIKG